MLVATSAAIEDYGGGGCGSLTPFEEMEADARKGGVDHIQGDRRGGYRATSTTSVA